MRLILPVAQAATVVLGAVLTASGIAPDKPGVPGVLYENTRRR